MTLILCLDATHRYSRFSLPDSLFPIPDSRFPIPDSRFPIPFAILNRSKRIVPTNPRWDGEIKNSLLEKIIKFTAIDIGIEVVSNPRANSVSNVGLVRRCCSWSSILIWEAYSNGHKLHPLWGKTT
ncbi:MAG: hypothetical protein F6K37_42320, partial [Moorea sp. SIO4E2]|uniref:hypothetical protein n=1 Tax=Moorena sp. SIO4E2 TaxID=2607826 RepID=UPI0013B829FD